MKLGLHLSVTEHVWGSQYTGGVEASQLEAYTTLGFIAARTRRVRLLTLATAVSYRHAGLLAKIVTTLDVLSGGRAMLGIGAWRLRRGGRGTRAAMPARGRAAHAAAGRQVRRRLQRSAHARAAAQA